MVCICQIAAGPDNKDQTVHLQVNPVIRLLPMQTIVESGLLKAENIDLLSSIVFKNLSHSNYSIISHPLRATHSETKRVFDNLLVK